MNDVIAVTTNETKAKRRKLPVRPLLPLPRSKRNGYAIGPHPLRGHIFGFVGLDDYACEKLSSDCLIMQIDLYENEKRDRGTGLAHGTRNETYLREAFAVWRTSDPVFVPDLRTDEDEALIEELGGAVFYGSDAARMLHHLAWLDMADD